MSYICLELISLEFLWLKLLSVPKSASSAEFYRLIRERIDYEENLINQRVIWLVFSQSFLVSAYAILLGEKQKAQCMPICNRVFFGSFRL